MIRPVLSVIIPTLNEAARIGRVLEAVLTEDVEVILVDGGSQDQTCAIARAMGVNVLHGPQGRGAQMNLGAKYATGEILLFLHGDTILPLQYQQHTLQCLAKKRVVAGGFRLQLEGKGLSFIAWGANLRSKWLGWVYGDQGLFLSKKQFVAAGCFPEVPILEDFMLILLLKKRGVVGLADGVVRSSSRRWVKHGVFKTTLLNYIIILGFFFGLSPNRLAKIYGVRNKI